MLALPIFLAAIFHLGLIALAAAQIWYSVPLVIVISLVWGATRHESLPEIITQSIKSLLWVLTFMGIIFAVIYVAGFFQ
jgi:hypothetical protein